MDFTRLNLKQYMTEGNSTPDSNLATTAERKASEQATSVSNPRQQDPVRKNMQLKQRSARTGPTTMSSTVDISPSAGPTAESFINQRNAIERRKLIEKSKVDWRSELMEAINPDDEPDHPYVEIMPHFKYKEKEAKKNTAKAAVKDRVKTGERAIGAPVNEEVIEEGKKDQKKSKQSHPKAPKPGKDRNISLETVYSPRIKKNIQKKAKELEKADKNSSRLAKKALDADRKEKAAYKKGDQKKGRIHRKQRLKLSAQARAARGKAMKYIPIGSTQYSSSSDATKMKGKFRSHLKTNSGRQRIALATEETHEITDK